MKKSILAIATALAAGYSPAAAAVDPAAVLITVDGKDVTVGEFDYLLNKNKSQQVNLQSIDDYLDMFINFRLKVADAERAGLQNEPGFVEEFTHYRDELAAPYMTSKETMDSLVNLAYSHIGTDVTASHIMLPNTPEGKAKAEELRRAILNGGTTFEDAAARFSIDRGTAQRKGLLGVVAPGQFPWTFEEAAYSTPAGQLSDVINSGAGYHIIRTESIRPSEGQVHAAHILRLTMNKSDEEKAAQKALIDSIYAKVMAGADFAALARQYSEDGSAARGGDLGWFGRGMMVQPFDSISFALTDGAISEPFATQFGYHFIKRFGHRTAPELSELRAAIEGAINRDARGQIPVRVKMDQYRVRYGASVDEKGMKRIADLAAGKPDSVFMADIAASTTAVASCGNKSITAADVAGVMSESGVAGFDAFRTMTERTLDRLVETIAREDLENLYPDYRNLVHEYRDGILLYNIANQKVWTRASSDTLGLENYFRQNAAKYAWNEPKFKGFVIVATNDSVLNEALSFAETVKGLAPADFTREMRAHLGRNAKVERVIAAKGENAIVDNLAFDGPRPDQTSRRWPCFAAFGGKIITNPEEAADVQAAVVADYQALLESEWLSDLHKKYKVKVNKKLLKKYKKEHSY